MDEPTVEQTSTQPVAQKKSSKTLKIIIGLVIFVVLVVLLALRATSPIIKPVQEQLKLLKDGNIKGAYELTSKDFQKATTLEEFKQFIKQYPSLSKNKSVSFTSREIKNNEGLLRGTLTAEDNGVTPVAYKLIKESGEWKIYGLQVGTSQ
jgi:Na+-transporting NADH:ubiquinone oxidoreductase subunit NqrC